MGTTSDHEGVEGKVNFNAFARFKVDGGSVNTVDNSVKVDKANYEIIKHL